jgi:acetyl coenzyme A synthetase (ADP forming)-like protein
MYKKRFDLKYMLSPRSVAVIGASSSPNKVGHVILQNYIDAGYSGKLYPVNTKEDTILELKAYKSVLNIKDHLDLAVIAVPAEIVPKVLEECGKANVKSVIVVSGGFAEMGRTDLQDKIIEIALKYNIAMLGPNCLGVMDPRSRVDTLFLPTYKLSRPKIGGVSFVSQSGAVGSTVLDLIAKEGFGLSKFISYGNAVVVDEVDILKYLGDDEDTKVIIMYIEGVKRGKEFIEISKEVTKKKPVIILKGGVTAQSASAVHSHTASLSGSFAAYRAVFRQFGFIVADDLSDLLNYAKAFSTEQMPTGKRVAIVTNGGGAGVLETDEIFLNGLTLAEFSSATVNDLKKNLPPIVAVRNPLDLVGDADDKRYEIALGALSKDPNVDMIIAIVLFQTPGADSKVVSTLIRYKNMTKIPIAALSPGADYTAVHKMMMENSGIPVYDSPAAVAKSFAKLLEHARYVDRHK